ncbi:MAG: hypothetical protein KKB31_02055 [Nanoarchaeota archaeon]|nr:hypothetical protein [Nanoarchaeota archaeon]
MNLGKKKALAIKTLKVGKGRIIFQKERLAEIKEAITKQDIRDLKKEGAIVVIGIKGRKKNTKRANRRSYGKIRKKVNKSKKEYILTTRKLRKHVRGLRQQGELSREEALEIRKKIRNRMFRSKAHLKENLKLR